MVQLGETEMVFLVVLRGRQLPNTFISFERHNHSTESFLFYDEEPFNKVNLSLPGIFYMYYRLKVSVFDLSSGTHSKAMRFTICKMLH